MAIVEYHQGCPIGGKASGCWGPAGNYYTLFGSELRFLTGHLVISILFGLILFGALLFLKKRKKINLPVYMIIIISIISIAILFFLLAYFFPTRVVY